MKFAIYDQNGKKGTKTAEINDSLVAGKANDRLLAQYLYIYLSNQREAVAHTKDRGEVSGGGKKPWKQKGTGRARAGSSRSPIWRGGGITFGPTNAKNWKKSINKKMKRAAIAAALAKLVAADKFKVVDTLDFKTAQLTKQGQEFVKAFNSPRKLTVIVGEKNQIIENAFSNLVNAKVVLVSELNAYDLINAGDVVMLENALAYTEHWI